MAVFTSGQSTELLHFKDTDGDGVADQKRIVLSGFGTEDTHHTLHTLRWGYDGQPYMNQSIYIHSHIETPHGVVRLNSGGILNFRPDTMELGSVHERLGERLGPLLRFVWAVLRHGRGGRTRNQLCRSAGHVRNLCRRAAHFGQCQPGKLPEVLQPGDGLQQTIPGRLAGQFYHVDFRANRVVRFSVNEQGSAYVTKEMPIFIRTTNVTFRPIDVKLGPDGALYIADWSNPIIQHGEVDFRDPRRDRVHGRIWRVTYKGRPALEAPQLVKASNTDLLDDLLSPNAFNKEQARRVLNDRRLLPTCSSWRWGPAGPGSWRWPS